MPMFANKVSQPSTVQQLTTDSSVPYKAKHSTATDYRQLSTLQSQALYSNWLPTAQYPAKPSTLQQLTTDSSVPYKAKHSTATDYRQLSTLQSQALYSNWLPTAQGLISTSGNMGNGRVNQH